MNKLFFVAVVLMLFFYSCTDFGSSELVTDDSLVSSQEKNNDNPIEVYPEIMDIRDEGDTEIDIVLGIVINDEAVYENDHIEVELFVESQMDFIGYFSARNLEIDGQYGIEILNNSGDVLLFKINLQSEEPLEITDDIVCMLEPDPDCIENPKKCPPVIEVINP